MVRSTLSATGALRAESPAVIVAATLHVCLASCTLEAATTHMSSANLSPASLLTHSTRSAVAVAARKANLRLGPKTCVLRSST